MQAEHLQAMGHCYTATPENLLGALQKFDSSKLVPYTAGDAAGIATAIEAHMDVLNK